MGGLSDLHLAGIAVLLAAGGLLIFILRSRRGKKRLRLLDELDRPSMYEIWRRAGNPASLDALGGDVREPEWMLRIAAARAAEWLNASAEFQKRGWKARPDLSVPAARTDELERLKSYAAARSFIKKVKEKPELSTLVDGEIIPGEPKAVGGLGGRLAHAAGAAVRGLGSGLGRAVGASVGSALLPGVGTLVGGAIGSFLGSVASGKFFAGTIQPLQYGALWEAYSELATRVLKSSPREEVRKAVGEFASRTLGVAESLASLEEARGLYDARTRPKVEKIKDLRWTPFTLADAIVVRHLRECECDMRGSELAAESLADTLMATVLPARPPETYEPAARRLAGLLLALSGLGSPSVSALQEKHPNDPLERDLAQALEKEIKVALAKADDKLAPLKQGALSAYVLTRAPS